MKKQVATILAGSLLMASLAACQTTETTTSNTTAGGAGVTSSGTEAPSDTTASAAETTGAATGERITLVHWHTLTDHHEEALLKRLDDFNKSQDKYTAVAEQQPYSEYDGKLMQAVRAGVGPDMVSAFSSSSYEYITQGFYKDMGPWVYDTTDGIPNFKTDISEGVYSEVNQWGEGKVFVIPTHNTGEVLYYNKTWYDAQGLKAPATWTELAANSAKIYEAYGVSGFGTDSIYDTFLNLIRQAGSDFIDPVAKKIVMDKDITIEKLNWYGDLVKNGSFRLVGEDRYFSNPFGSQAVGSYIGSSASIDYVGAAIPTEGDGKFEFDVVPIPQEGSVKYINYWGAGYANLATSEEKQRGVYELIKYIVSPEVAAQAAIDYGSIPVYKSARDLPIYQEYITTNPAVKALNEELPYVGHTPTVKGMATVRTELAKMVESVALGVSDAETAYTNFVTVADQALAE